MRLPSNSFTKSLSTKLNVTLSAMLKVGWTSVSDFFHFPSLCMTAWVLLSGWKRLGNACRFPILQFGCACCEWGTVFLSSAVGQCSGKQREERTASGASTKWRNGENQKRVEKEATQMWLSRWMVVWHRALCSTAGQGGSEGSTSSVTMAHWWLHLLHIK